MDTNGSAMPGADRDEDSGRYVDKYPPEHFLEAIEEHGGYAGTGEIADYVAERHDRDPDEFHDTTYKKLRKMENNGTVTSRKIGNSRAWELPDE